MSDPDHRRALLLALFVTVLWSSSWVFIRIGLDDEGLAPVTFAGLRYAVAAAVLVTATATRSRHRSAVRALGRGDLGMIALLGVVLIALTQGAQFVALDHQPAATTSLVLSLTPLMVAFASGRSLRESPSAAQLAGAAMVAAGAVLYFSGSLGATLVGMIAAIVGLTSNVAGSLLGRAVNRARSVDPLVVTTISMTVGALLLVVTGLLAEGIPHLSAKAVMIVLWLAVVNTAWAFTLWNHSLRHLTATESAVINNTMLIQIAVLAWLFLSETPSVIQIAGIALVTLGIIRSQRK